jgi:hypothetical protein
MVQPADEPLTFEVLDDLIVAHERGLTPAVRLVPGPCLGALVELFHFNELNSGALGHAETPDLALLRRCLETGRPVFLDNEAIGYVPARRVRRNGEDAHLTAFLFALHKALLAAGFPSPFVQGLVGALGELEDNIHEHSGAIESGVLAYRVSTERVELTVADRGVGILKSLRSGAFPSLADAGEALKLALTDGRSRFVSQTGRGYGFRQLFKALVLRQGTLRFRSDDQLLTIAGVSPSLSRARLQQRARVAGFAVTVICANPGSAQRV